ncbi:geraniol 8-hydroxylase-like [Gastrolobium bilobum]|uniref:geraniol 8-hydroxylase-like n=1 Tax=Gastrolobium bilobum TaxID=150636 RepID=UPI002AB26BDF|nr:geraniol 8-hydroxylase-like [Gastrolobium bilobum]
MEFLSCVFLLVLTFTLAQALRSLLSRGKNNAKYKLPPGPSPLPILGNLLALGKKPHQSLAKLAHIYGPIMSLKLGQVTTIVVSSPEMAKEVLQTHDQFLSNRAVPEAAAVHNHEKYGIAFLPVSPLWRDLRKLCNTQLFSNKSLDESQELRRNKLQELIHDIQQSSLIGEAVDIGRATFNTAINLLSNTIFSVDLFQSAGSVGEFKKLIVNIMEEGGKPNLADFFPALRKVDPQRIKSRNGSYIGKIIDISSRLVDQRLKQREVQGFDTNNDMLNTLLNIAQDNTQEMDRTQIEHLSLTLFLGGTDTIKSTVEWTMAELLKNEKAMSKVKQELEQTIGKGKHVEESDIARLPYLQAVIKETLRLHPPVPFLIPRKAIANVEISGYTIPKDANVLVNVWAIGRNSSIWKNANVFSPERFLSSEIDVNGRHYELTPFGSGRRICPGYPLALRMLYLMLGSLLNCFDWKLEDGVKIDDMNMDDNFGLTLGKAQPVRIIPEKISNSCL